MIFRSAKLRLVCVEQFSYLPMGNLDWDDLYQNEHHRAGCDIKDGQGVAKNGDCMSLYAQSIPADFPEAI